MLKQRLNKAVLKVRTMDALRDFKKKLSDLGRIPNDEGIYLYACDFFNIITEFQDKYQIDSDMFKETPEFASALAKHIEKAGRQEYGWVRAKSGETVTLNNLYLGGIDGLPTKTAGFWRDNARNDKEAQASIQGQLRRFIQSHRDDMIRLSMGLINNNKKPDNLLVRAALKRNAHE